MCTACTAETACWPDSGPHAGATICGSFTMSCGTVPEPASRADWDPADTAQSAAAENIIGYDLDRLLCPERRAQVADLARQGATI